MQTSQGSSRLETSSIFSKLDRIDQFAYPTSNDLCLLEYIYPVGGKAWDIRSITITCKRKPKTIEDCPSKITDGSKSEQMPGNEADMIIQPVRLFAHPFRGHKHFVVLCHCQTLEGDPVSANTRSLCVDAMDKHGDTGIQAGFKQHFAIQTRIVGDQQDSRYFHGNGPDSGVFGRLLAEAHFNSCIKAGLSMSSYQAGLPGQWRYSLGPCEAVEACDELIVSRWILIRLGEMADISVSFDPLLRGSQWTRARLLVTLSSSQTRERGGLRAIMELAQRLRPVHLQFINEYFEPSMSHPKVGRTESKTTEVFTIGIGDRGACIRIPRETHKSGAGWLEDRRPGSNADPYNVLKLLVQHGFD